MVGTVSCLSVGEGDIKLTFDRANPVECIRAARIVKDMIRRGYAMLVEVEPGKYQRAHDFDEAALAYVIADYDPLAQQPEPHIKAERKEHGQVEQPVETAAPSDAAPKSKAVRQKKRLVPADTTRAVSVGRTAGG